MDERPLEVVRRASLTYLLATYIDAHPTSHGRRKLSQNQICEKMPRISIAIPVFNGATMLEEALANLRDQTCRDIEIVVFDNASTDRTAELTEGFVSSDPRFRLIRRPMTIPAMENFQDALRQCDCEFFAWRAYDDLSAPDFFEKLSDLLRENTHIDLAVGEVRTFKPHKKQQWTTRPLPKIPTNRLQAALRLMNVSPASWFYGLYRRERVLREFTRATAALPQGWATDHLTMFPLLITGRLGITEKTHFIQRLVRHPGKTNWVPPTISEQWQIRQTFYRYCVNRIDETDFSPTSKLILKAAAVRYASRRTFRTSKLLVRLLKGS